MKYVLRSVSAKVPGGEYAALRFTFGIDGAKNATGTLPSVNHFNNMAWPAPARASRLRQRRERSP